MGNQPFARSTTYAAGSQVKSADLNEFQDVNIANIGDLILGLGGTTANDLNDVIQQDTFTPVFSTSFAGGSEPTFTTQYGRYTRIGQYVFVDIRMAWTNNDAAHDASSMSIVLPYQPAAESVGVATGSLHPSSDLGAQDVDFTFAAPIVGTLGRAFIRGRATTFNSALSDLLYGNDARDVFFHIDYCTDGTFNY